MILTCSECTLCMADFVFMDSLASSLERGDTRCERREGYCTVLDLDRSPSGLSSLLQLPPSCRIGLIDSASEPYLISPLM